jgi:hypothetical protein
MLKLDIQLVVSEEVHQGHVSWKAIKLLVLNCSSWPATFYCGYLLGCVFNETLEVFQLCMYLFAFWAFRDLTTSHRVAGPLGKSVQWTGCGQHRLLSGMLCSYHAAHCLDIVSSRLVHEEEQVHLPNACYSVSLSIMSTFASINVGRAVHNRLTSSLLAATFRWLDTVPTSRVISRSASFVQARLARG